MEKVYEIAFRIGVSLSYLFLGGLVFLKTVISCEQQLEFLKNLSTFPIDKIKEIMREQRQKGGVDKLAFCSMIQYTKKKKVCLKLTFY